MGALIARGTDPETVAKAASKVLGDGGIIVYPTETIYGLGADPFNKRAMAKLYRLKGRDKGKPVSVAIGDAKDIERYAEVCEVCRRLMDRFLPGPLTLVLPAKDKRLCGLGDSVGIRVPGNAIALGIARAFGPFTSTSANVSGSGTPDDIGALERMFGDQVDLYIEASEPFGGTPSTVVECRGAKVRVLREGAISRKDIRDLGVEIDGQ